MIRLASPLRSLLLSSGPHHGHYVSIVKAGGVWKLFDDDTVETIKESDIPKYFGDSNCGSAYVLYYQAVDINLPSLGLRPPTPQPAPNSVPVAASIAPDDGQVPILPPGLTTEHDSSDLAESSGPTTPSPSNPTYSPKINSSPIHSKLNLPPPDFPPPPPIPQQPPQKPQGGLFHSLRHVPSVKINRHSSDKRSLHESASTSSANAPPSGSVSSPANVSTPHLNKPEVTSSISASPSVEPASPKSNGVGKDKWYKRKGIRSKEKEKSLLKAPTFDKRPSSVPGGRSEGLAPPSPASTIGSVSQRSSSPSHPQSESEGKGEKPVLPPNLVRSPTSVHRPTTADSSSGPSFTDDIPAVPPLPPLPSSPTMQTYRASRPLPQPRPPLPVDLREERAATTTDTTGQGSGEWNGHAMPNGDFDHHARLRPNSLHADLLATTSSSSSDLLTAMPGAPPDANAPLNADVPSPGMMSMSQTMIGSSLSSVTAPSQGSSGAESNWKRATRKLSLTSTMLGFAKKEKHKDKLGVIP